MKQVMQDYLGRTIYFTTIPDVTFNIKEKKGNVYYMLSSSGRRYDMTQKDLDTAIEKGIAKMIQEKEIGSEEINYFNLDDL